jgi:hypothetical protein
MLHVNRYVTAHTLFSNFFSSKLSFFRPQPLPKLKALRLRAGLYKLSTVKPEHSFLLSALSGNNVQTHIQFHGKRQKKTVSINADLTDARLWGALDKFTHELIPHMQDLKTPKGLKRADTNTLTLRVRQKFTIVEEFEEILENNFYDVHKGVYLPLTLHFCLAAAIPPALLETYLRMLRLPIQLYRRKPRPAYDDKIVFSGMAELYRQFTLLRRTPKKK